MNEPTAPLGDREPYEPLELEALGTLVDLTLGGENPLLLDTLELGGSLLGSG